MELHSDFDDARGTDGGADLIGLTHAFFATGTVTN